MLPHGHRAAALAAHGDALTPMNADVVAVPPAAVPPMVPLADMDTDAGAFHGDALRRHGGDRGGRCHDRRGRKAEQCCAHVPLHRCLPASASVRSTTMSGFGSNRWRFRCGAAQRSRSSWLSLATRSNASPALLMRYW